MIAKRFDIAAAAERRKRRDGLYGWALVWLGIWALGLSLGMLELWASIDRLERIERGTTWEAVQRD